MLSPLDPNSKCLEDFYIDFRRKIISLLGYQFSEFPPSLGISLLSNNVISIESKGMDKINIIYLFMKKIPIYKSRLITKVSIYKAKNAL